MLYIKSKLLFICLFSFTVENKSNFIGTKFCLIVFLTEKPISRWKYKQTKNI